MTRAERRAQAARWKARCRYYWVAQRRPGEPPQADPRIVGKVARTRRPCSCPWCLNQDPRPARGMERRQALERAMAAML